MTQLVNLALAVPVWSASDSSLIPRKENPQSQAQVASLTCWMGVLDVPDLIEGFKVETPESVVAFALTTDQLAVGTADSEIWILNRQNGSVLHTLKGHKGGTNSLVYAAGNRLISAGEDGKAAVWDHTNGAQLESLDVEGLDADTTSDGHTVTNIAVSADGNHFACSSGRRVHLIDVLAQDVESGRKIYPPVAATVADVKLTTDGFVLASYYGGISCWPMDVGIPGFELPHQGALLSADVAKLPDGSMWFVAGCQDATVHIWKVSPGNMPGRLQIVELSCAGYEQKVEKCDFDLTGRFLASIGGSRNTVWDFSSDGPSGRVPICTAGHTKRVSCQAWQPKEGGLLATGGEDGRVLVYNIRDVVEGLPQMCIPCSTAETLDDPVTQIAWGPDAQLYSGHASGLVRQWKLPELPQTPLDSIMASYALLGRDPVPQPQLQGS